MSLCKAIAHGKEKRKPYRGSGAFDWSCHNHKSCAYCRGNRLHQQRRLEEMASAEVQEAHIPEPEGYDYHLCVGCGRPGLALYDTYARRFEDVPPGWQDVGGRLFCPDHQLVVQVVMCDGVPVA